MKHPNPEVRSGSLSASGEMAEAVSRTREGLSRDAVALRLRDRDHTLWREDPREIADRLGWLSVADEMPERLGEIRGFVQSLDREGVRDVVLLGMGGSSLAPEVFRRTFGSTRMRLHVLDTTSPAWIRRVTEALDPGRSHVLVASKSGSTIEVRALLAHFAERIPGGDSFSAITDPETGLHRLAEERGFRNAFLNPPDIGGRYSALSLFGLVPAAVLGMDLDELLRRARELAVRCGPEAPVDENPGLDLGAVLGAGAKAGRDKMTLLTSPGLDSFGLWIEQLVAESVGKDGRGVVPVCDEPGSAAATSGGDRLHVAIRLAGEENEELDRRLSALESAGQPVYGIEVPDRIALGAEMLRWEIATAVLGHLLDVHPFDQPDVQSTKDRTNAILEGRAPAVPPASKDPTALVGEMREGDWLALLVFGDVTGELVAAADELRRAVLETRGTATTFGMGPRFLHSTGQLHKGGPDTGVFLQLVLEEEPLPIPGWEFGFGDLLRAQADGDLAALQEAGRRVTRIDGRGDPAGALRRMAREVRET